MNAIMYEGDLLNNIEPITASKTGPSSNFFFFCLFRATPAAYASCQARGQIRTTAAGLCYSKARSTAHVNARFLTH